MAAKHYSTRDFMRHMPSGLAARYFALHEVLAGLNEAGLAEGKKGTPFGAWLGLSLAKRRAMHAERQHCTTLRKSC